jgi:hypothetical protein
MTPGIINRQARRAAKITGTMIDHGVAILESADETYTHVDDDGQIAVCNDCIVQCLRTGWSSNVQKPKTEEQWRILGFIVVDLIAAEKTFERQASVGRQLH